MNARPDCLEELARRVRDGDGQARAQMDRALTPQLAWLLHRATTQGEHGTPLGRRLLRVASRLDAEAPVASQACQLSRFLLNRLRPGSTWAVAGDTARRPVG